MMLFKFLMIRNFKGYLCILGGFLIHFSLGSIYTFGNISPYIASYMRSRPITQSVKNSDMVWIFAFALASQGLTMSFGGVLDKKVGSRFTVLIGCCIMSASVILTYFTIQANIYVTILTYGVIFGFGVGIAYSVVLAASIKWFPNNKGLVIGVVVAGFGLGSLAFNQIQTLYINPQNISPNFTKGDTDRYFTDEKVLEKVPYCFLYTGIIYASIQLIGCIILFSPSQTEMMISILSNTGSSNSELSTNFISETYDDENNIQSLLPKDTHDSNIFKAIKQRDFWILWFIFMFCGTINVYATSLYKTFGQLFITSDYYLALVGSVASIFNAMGRIFWGQVMDRFSYKVAIRSIIINSTILMGTFYLCHLVPNSIGARVMFLIWVCGIFANICGIFAVMPAITAKLFGLKKVVTIYGILFSANAFAGIFGALTTSIFLSKINYFGIFGIGAGLTTIALILTFLHKRIDL